MENKSSYTQLLDLARSITSEEVRRVVLEILENPVLTFTTAKPLISLEESPAAPRKHHFFKGGLLVHTTSVARLALELAKILEEVYGLHVDRDIALAAALLHDIFKYYQYEVDESQGGYKLREDWFLGHDYAIVAELARRGAPDKLVRAVSEVHGLVPFSTIEGLVVNLADSIDARLGEQLQNMVLSKVKSLEAEQCKIFKALNYAIEKYSVKGVFSLLQSNPEELRKIIEDLCKSLK